MDSTPPAPSGVLLAVEKLGAVLLDTLHDRVALISVEIQEEKQRMLQMLAWLSAAIVAGTLAIIFASLTLVYLSWETARIPVLIGLTLLYAVATAGLVWGLNAFLARQRPPFSTTLEELREDRACLRKKV